MAKVVFTEHDAMFRLLGCLLDPDYRVTNAGWAAQQLWPEVVDPATTFTSVAAEHGLHARSVGFTDQGPDHEACVMVTESVTIDRRFLRSYPQVRHVIRFGEAAASVDLWGDDILLSTFRRRVTASVAEHAIALLLGLLRHLPTVDHRVRNELPRRRPSSYSYNWLGISPRLLEGRTVSLLGFGEIGRAVAVRLAPFGANLLYWSRRRVPHELECGARHVRALDEALVASDVVIIALPLSDQTRGLIGEAELASIGPSGVLINISRGDIIDEMALVDALVNGRLGGAGLDVFRYEPLPADHPLRGTPRTILTPHCAGGDRALQLEELVELARLVMLDVPSTL